MGILCFLVYAFIIMLVVRAILSWIHPTQGPLAAIDHIAGQITEPVLGPVRRQIPPIRLGGVALDTAVPRRAARRRSGRHRARLHLRAAPASAGTSGWRRSALRDAVECDDDLLAVDAALGAVVTRDGAQRGRRRPGPRR